MAAAAMVAPPARAAPPPAGGNGEERALTDAGTQAVGQAGADEKDNASSGGDSGAGMDAGPAAATAADEIMGAGQRSYGMGRDGESHNSLPRQRGDCKPPGGLQMSETGRGGGSRREGDTRHEWKNSRGTVYV